MNQTRDAKTIFEWAKLHGDAKIVDRILVSLLPELLKNNLQLTSKFINDSKTIETSDELFNIIKTKSEELVGSSFAE